MVQNSVEKIPVGAVACMMKWWEPPNKCSCEEQHGIACNWRIYCEKLSQIINWNEGYRPKSETMRKFICKNCKLPEETKNLRQEVKYLFKEWEKANRETQRLKAAILLILGETNWLSECPIKFKDITPLNGYTVVPLRNIRNDTEVIPAITHTDIHKYIWKEISSKEDLQPIDVELLPSYQVVMEAFNIAQDKKLVQKEDVKKIYTALRDLLTVRAKKIITLHSKIKVSQILSSAPLEDIVIYIYANKAYDITRDLLNTLSFIVMGIASE